MSHRKKVLQKVIILGDSGYVIITLTSHNTLKGAFGKILRSIFMPQISAPQRWIVSISSVYALFQCLCVDIAIYIDIY